MRHHIIIALKACLFLAIGVALFFKAQDLMVTNELINGTPEKAVKGYLALDKDSVDVLILGASHPEFAISPMQLYEETGIVSYNLAMGAQQIECNYYTLREALKTQTPKIVLLDPETIFREWSGSDNLSWRFLLDSLPLDDVKLEMATDYGSREFGDGYWSAIFPIIKYHNRWEELTEKDFRPHWKGLYYTAGGLLVSYIIPSGATFSDIEGPLKMMRERSEGVITEFDGRDVKSEIVEGELFRPQIFEEKWDYLMKIKSLCQESGAELILVTIPTLQPHWLAGGWTTEKSALMKEYAASEGLTYLDLVCDYNLVNYTTDTFDGGMHLNCRGMEKVTRFLGEYLKTKITPSGSNALYQTMTVRYDKALEVAMLESETDFYEYIDRLAHRLDRSTIYIAVDEEYTSGLTADDYTLLQEKLGIRLIRNGGYADSYMAVIDKGELLYEALSDRVIERSMQIGNVSAKLHSSGVFSLPDVSVSLNDTEYARGGRGLNIVVYDYESGGVIDSVSFDTFQASKPALRDYEAADDYLRAYESAVCF